MVNVSSFNTGGRCHLLRDSRFDVAQPGRVAEEQDVFSETSRPYRPCAPRFRR